MTNKPFNFIAALSEFHNIFNVDNPDPRAIAILGGTFLEMALESILHSFLPDDEKEVDKLFEFNGPLGNFSNKINMSYCLGLIDTVIMNDLNFVRKIRNKFAHNLYAKFDDAQIIAWTESLKFHKISMMMNPPEDATVLQIFQVGVNQLIMYLHGCIGITNKCTIRSTLSEFLPVK